MTILVTGGAGFIGSHVADALLADGHQVIIIDDLSTGVTDNIPAAATFYNGSIVDEKILEQLFTEHTIDIVCHLAAQIDARKSVEEPVHDAMINIIGSLQLLEMCRKHSVKKVVFTSTGGVMYGDTDIRPTPETHEALPVSPYALAKQTIENYLRYYSEVFSLPYAALRLGNVYGPRQNPHGEAGVIAIFMNKILSGDTPVVNGDGETTRDYVYVQDVVSAVILAVNELDMTGVFNVGTGTETSVNELFDHIASHVQDRDIVREHGPAKPEQRHSALSSEKLQTLFNWKPTKTIADGIAETWKWFNS